MNIGYFVWDPNPAMFPFKIPLLNRPLLWYGFFFALGFFLGYLVLLYLLKHSIGGEKRKVVKLAEELTFYVAIGAVVGARLGDLLFYQKWSEILSHPLSIIAVWEGGLASHGGAIGILIALGLFAKRKKIPFWSVVDFTVIPVAIAAVCIRIGNFFNQEILGTATTLPWGVLFLHPADRGAVVPRHPAQLYEALCYLIIFGILLFYFHRHFFTPRGKLTGLFLILVFCCRFFIEFVKVEQSVYTLSWLNMGQLLSLPFIVLGFWLFLRKTT